MAGLQEGIAAHESVAPLGAFKGTVIRTRPGLLYRVGLAIVAFAMVLLPLVYVALIILAAWGVWLHLAKDTWIFEGGSGGVLFRLISA